jgi:hypothetical protein
MQRRSVIEMYVDYVFVVYLLNIYIYLFFQDFLKFWKNRVISDPNTVEFRDEKCGINFEKLTENMVSSSHLLDKEITEDDERYSFRISIAILGILSFTVTLLNIVFIITLCRRRASL